MKCTHQKKENKMDREQFRKEVRLTRGKLTNMDSYMNNIYDDGVPELRDLCINNKQMGIKNISELTNLTHDEQYELYDWLKAKGFKASKNEMSLKISFIIVGIR